MAKKSKIARNKQREAVVARYAERRAELKKALVDPNSTDEQREEARIGLQKLPRNASPVRLRSRDVIDGRPRGVLSKFGISRVRFRDMAHRGERGSSDPRPFRIPGAGEGVRRGRRMDTRIRSFSCAEVLLRSDRRRRMRTRIL